MTRLTQIRAYSDNDMEEKNRKDRENNISRHTWIGDEEETKRQAEITERKTYTLTPEATRIVDKQRKKRTGFITDEELRNSDIIRIEDRRTTLVNKEDILRRGSDTVREEVKAPEPKPSYITVKAPEGGRRKAFFAVLVLIAALLIFEISFFVMRSNADSLPARTDAAIEETSKLEKENKKLEQKTEKLGDEEQIKELKESWERLREKLGNTE